MFDTPPSGRETRLALALIAVLSVSFLAVLPFVNHPLPEVLAAIPTVTSILFVGELIVASLLFAQAEVYRSRALTVLATGHVVTALLLIPYSLSFPGTFAPGGLLDPGVNTTAWLMIFRRWGAPLTVIIYALLKEADRRASRDVEPPPRVLTWVVCAAATAGALTLLATLGHDLLPPMFVDRNHTVIPNLFLFNLSNIVLLVIAIGLLLRRRDSVLEVWLAVSLAAMLIESLLNIPLRARFTLGFYSLLAVMVFAHLFVLLALIAESNRLYVRLALSTAARSRERDARLMSMDGVAAAISHEVGQPLAAVSLSASAGLRWLTRERPEPAMAIKSLQDTVEAADRAFAVVKSIRATFGKGRNALSEFDLNDLVRESAGLLDRELAAEKVSLRLALDEGLPPILGNRVQIQRVLVNLLTNAIESLGAGKRRGRRISIRSAASDGQTVRIEVSDSGAGIRPDAMSHIFDPFFTTKSTGTGLGLSLSRTIVEGHGGRLWASAADEGGATFHIELRRTPAPDA